MRKDKKFCKSCEFVGEPQKKVKGNLFFEIVLWLMFILPGVLYSIYRYTGDGPVTYVCPKCGNSRLIPIDSPAAKRALND